MSFTLAVALDGLGWHPDAPGDRAAVFTPDHWVRLVKEADDAQLDFVTFEDTFGPPENGHPRLDAVLVAARVAPLTRHVGLVPVATTTHTEPFHLSTALASLDHVSRGRAGWQVRVSGQPAEATLLGRRAPLGFDDVFAEAADAVEVVRRLWDSWQDDAVIRDAGTGRFIDRDRLHYIDFDGTYFSVKGPSIVPRPPQGQPVVAAVAHNDQVLDFAAGVADLAFTAPPLLEAPPAAGNLQVLADLVVSLDGAPPPTESDAAIFAGTVGELADLLVAWPASGFRLRPARLATDLPLITRQLVPLLRARGHWQPRPGTLRERLGLPAAVNRYEQGARVA